MTQNNGWTLPVSQRAAALTEEIRRQSRPRRWFWQEKTIRDLLEDRRADLAEVALSRSAKLAAAAAEQHNNLLTELQRQSQPRRWRWQQPTAHDKLTTQRERLASAALERANALTEAAGARRDLLLAEARRQSQPRRWFWQEKTLRDKIEDQKQAVLGQAQPSRWPWEEATLRDRLDQRRQGLRGTIADALSTTQDGAATAAERVRHGARSTADLVQNQLSLAPQRLGDAADALRESADHAGQRVWESADLATQRVRERAEQAATTARSAALVPVEAVRSSVESGQQALTDTVEASKRSARRGVRVGRVFLWALLIGGVIGLLFAPRAGEETRRNLVALWKRILETVAPSN